MKLKTEQQWIPGREDGNQRLEEKLPMLEIVDDTGAVPEDQLQGYY